MLSMKRDTKALLRRGMALAALGELARAKDDFVHVLSVEPNNRWACSLQTQRVLGCTLTLGLQASQG